MGISSGKSIHAGDRDGSDCVDDCGKPPAQRGHRFWRHAARLILILAVLPVPCLADSLRIATYNVGLSRKGPGLLLADMLDGKARDAEIAAAVIQDTAPDILLLTGFDFDAGGQALANFDKMIGDGRPAYPHHFALRPNTGTATGLDLNRDGRTGGPGDAQGFGWFAGQGGMAILSRWPIAADHVVDLSQLLWRDLPDASLPVYPDGKQWHTDKALSVQRLSTTGHWDVPVTLNDGTDIHLLAFYASPPVFDGPEDRNGLRNRDELRLWTAYLDGQFELHLPDSSFVIIGDANLDPHDGDGRTESMRAFLADPRLTDPKPASSRAVTSNDGHRGDPAQDTVLWPGSPGNLRVDYVLPSSDLRVIGSGVVWPDEGEPLHDLVSSPDGPRHRLVWVDIAR